jgi:hypothetical protein
LTSDGGEAAAKNNAAALHGFILAAAIAILGAAVFAPAVSGGFVYDDRPLVRRLGELVHA